MKTVVILILQQESTLETMCDFLHGKKPWTKTHPILFYYQVLWHMSATPETQLQFMLIEWKLYLMVVDSLKLLR